MTSLRPLKGVHVAVSCGRLPRAPLANVSLTDAAHGLLALIVDMQPKSVVLLAAAAGQRLYLAARAGETVERAPRPISVSQFDVWRDAPDSQDVHLRIRCSKGTYIRSLAHDLVRR